MRPDKLKHHMKVYKNVLDILDDDLLHELQKQRDIYTTRREAAKVRRNC